MSLFSFTKKISFQAFDEWVDVTETSPIPASSCMPSWYKELPRYVNNSDKPIKSLGVKDLKMCVPFRDAMISGYMLVTPADIEVAISATGDVDVFQNPTLGFQVVHKRGLLTKENQGFGMPNPIGTTPIMFAWSPTWGVRTNKKDSVLITHPFNRHDLPFITTSGIIDSGFYDKAGNIPFFIKEGFTGIIPKGTPVAQVLPYKREEWVSKKIPSDRKNYSLFMSLRDSYLEGFYSRFKRQNKSYK